MENVRRQQGFTLIELAIALAVLLILVAVGMPDFGTTSDKRHLQGATEALQQDLRFARAEAIKTNESVRVAFMRSTDTDWCWGMTQGATTCDCTAGTCLIDGVERIKVAADFKGVRMPANPSFSGNLFTTINPTHGTASAGTVEFASGKGVLASVKFSPLGRVRLCTPVATGATSGVKYGYEYDASC